MSTPSELRRVESQAYPAFHIGFLDAKQSKALEQFRALVQDKGLWTPAHDGKPASHDDETLLRYLRARKWVPNDAFTQFRDTETWRKENQIDKMYELIDVDEYEIARRLYPQWTGRRDKRGIPLYVFEVAHLTTKAVAAFDSSKRKPGEVQSDLPPRMLRLFALYENLTNFALPLCSMIGDRQYPQTPVSQSSNIVDISNVSLKQFWNLKSHMQDASTLATAYYPETLDRIFILGAPSFFPTVWGWIKRWFDPITVSKIFILSKADALPTLTQFVDIENIPKKYGGKLDFTFGDLAHIEDKIHEHVQWINPEVVNGQKTFPTGPIRWRQSADGKMVAAAVGTKNGQARSVDVASIIPPQDGLLRDVIRPSPNPTEGLARLPSAIDTHPPSPPAGESDQEVPPSGESTPAHSTRGAPQAVEPTATTEVPLALRTSTPSGTTNTIREGTTSTRYEQQASTHGHGQLKESTPDTRKTGDGDEVGIMEPGTVSQAPKEHPVPEVEEPAPGIVEQVKGVAGSAYGMATAAAASVAASVGLGGHTPAQEDETDKKEEKQRDPEVEHAPAEQVEAFLRAKTASMASDNAATGKA